jgi:hypothetical protein
MESQNTLNPDRFKCCKTCVAIIDILMDRYFQSKKVPEFLFCASCVGGDQNLHNAVTEVVSAAGVASKIIFKMGPGPKIEHAPYQQTWICVHCGKQHKQRSMLKLNCNDDVYFNPILVWTYSIKLDARGLAVNYINARIGH